MNRSISIAASILGLTFSAAAGAQSVRAYADIQSCTDTPVSGRMVLVERASEEGVKVVDVMLRVKGLPDGRHAVHLHEVGTCMPCGDAKGHFDPGPAGMSSPDGNHPYHSGDLINIDIKNGEGIMQTLTSRVTLSPGPLSVFDDDGSAVIIHVDPDSYCPEGEAKGCAGGARAACGVIDRP